MLVVETIAKIRRAHFQNGHSIKKICRDLRVSRNTVRKVIRSGATEFNYDRTTQPRPKIGPWQADLDEMLADFAAESTTENEGEVFSALDDINSLDSADIKLDLANTYVEMGDPEGAKEILEELISEADADGKAKAQALLDSLK